jgi:hypothetical protein
MTPANTGGAGIGSLSILKRMPTINPASKANIISFTKPPPPRFYAVADNLVRYAYFKTSCQIYSSMKK